MQPLVSIQNLSVHFSGSNKPALQNISLQVKQGEVLAIVGESGSGKSVTALSVLQLLPSPPAQYISGNIFFNGSNEQVDLLQYNRQQLQQVRGNHISMIFQEPMTSLNPVLTCGSQVAEALVAHKKLSLQQAKQQTIKLFEQVQLPQPALIYNRYPHEISGGQKQRVMIAMAMSCSPALLICDEPTTALDVAVQKNILQLIKQLQQETNMGVVFISHDLALIAGIADTIAVMYRGEIVEQGSKENILSYPKHPYTKALLACRPGLYKRNQRLPVVSDFMEVNADGSITEKPVLRLKEIPVEQVSNKPLLTVENLRVWYPVKTTLLGKVTAYHKAVDDISFNVYEGETLGLVGASGCGKTTVGKTIAGLLKATAGSILFDEVNLVTASTTQWKQLRKDIQIIFQDPYSSLNPSKTIGDAIAEPMLVHRLCAKQQCYERVVDLLQKVGLQPDHYHRYPHEFSGGQRQRIVIARALALQPRFLICDESVAALDVSVQAQVLNLLNDLKKEFGFTSIFISHDLSVVKYISDRIIIMRNGTIQQVGDAEDIYQHFQGSI